MVWSVENAIVVVPYFPLFPDASPWILLAIAIAAALATLLLGQQQHLINV